MEGRFTRLFPFLTDRDVRDRGDLERLADQMVARAEPESTRRRARSRGEPWHSGAYTYFGQFVDHDLTFDPISHLRPALTRPSFSRWWISGPPFRPRQTCTGAVRTTSLPV